MLLYYYSLKLLITLHLADLNVIWKTKVFDNFASLAAINLVWLVGLAVNGLRLNRLVAGHVWIRACDFRVILKIFIFQESLFNANYHKVVDQRNFWLDLMTVQRCNSQLILRRTFSESLEISVLHAF